MFLGVKGAFLFRDDFPALKTSKIRMKLLYISHLALRCRQGLALALWYTKGKLGSSCMQGARLCLSVSGGAFLSPGGGASIAYGRGTLRSAAAAGGFECSLAVAVHASGAFISPPAQQ